MKITIDEVARIKQSIDDSRRAIFRIAFVCLVMWVLIVMFICNF